MAFLGILISTKKQVLFSYFTQSQADFLKSRLLKFSYQAGAKICYHLTPCNHISSDWLKNLLYEFLSAARPLYFSVFLEKNKVQQLLRKSCIVQNFVLLMSTRMTGVPSIPSFNRRLCMCQWFNIVNGTTVIELVSSSSCVRLLLNLSFSSSS